MKTEILKTKAELGKAAAVNAASYIKKAIAAKGKANIILATGASQFEMLSELVKADIDWSKGEDFHLDEYVGLPVSHPASFRKYLKERFAEKVGGLFKFNYVNADVKGLSAELDALGRHLAGNPIDVACVGIGENGHLAFNDPPADFDTEEPYVVVTLDDACRKQQLGEGWFPSFDDVPKQAVSMSIRQIMKSKAIVCTVPDARKAKAVRDTLAEGVTNLVPASILKTHPDCTLLLDEPAASLLKR
jgi:glucosamine-6-phosphate deaminase